MELAGEPPPLWPQLTNTTSITRRHRRSPSPLFTPPVLIILLPTILLLILFFAVPPFLSSVASQISRPTGVKKSSDSLTILLVFFAILSWVFARRNDGDNANSMDYHGSSSNNNKLSPANPVSQRWFDQYAERKFYDDNPPMNAAASAAEQPTTSLRRLKRSSTSYPDLRQDSLWENSEDRNRFYDDFEINKYRSSTNNYIDQVHELRRSWRSEQFEESEFNVIPPLKSPAPSTPPPPPPPPPPAAAYQKPRRTYQAIGQKEKVTSHVEFDRSESPQPVTPPPPPPPPPRRPPSPLTQAGNRSEQRFAKLERRKSNAAKEIKMVFASLRKRKKKKKGSTSTKDHDHHQHDCPLHSQSEPPPYYSTTIPPPSPPPPPPPPMPPPPSSVFQKYNLFRSKGSKSKKIHSVPPAPPPPPPPPQHSVSKFMQNIQTPPTTPPPAPPTPPPGPSRRRTTPKSSRPPLPTKANTSIYFEENVNSGGQSPLIPNPPPPPPFKMPDFKFVFRGDFVNIRSSPSSRCSSPDLEEVNAPSSKYDDNDEKVSMMEGDDGGGVGGGVPVNCPSPDVNAKAETFIARFRDGWKLEKINSMKEKQRI